MVDTYDEQKSHEKKSRNAAASKKKLKIFHASIRIYGFE